MDKLRRHLVPARELEPESLTTAPTWHLGLALGRAGSVAPHLARLAHLRESLEIQRFFKRAWSSAKRSRARPRANENPGESGPPSAGRPG